MKKNLIALALFSSLTFSCLANLKTVNEALDAEDVVVAEKAFAALSPEDKSSVAGEVLAGRLLLAKDESEEAFEHFEELRDQQSENVDVNYYLGVSAVVMAQKASIFSKLGYAEDFLEAMEKTIALKPDHKKALNTLIGFHLGAPSIAGGDTDKALTYANHLKTLDAEQGYSQLANVYWQTEKQTLAQDTILAGLKAFPESGLIYFTRANAYLKEEDWANARADLLNAVKYAKDDKEKSRALYQQGKVSAESGKELDLGIESLTMAIPLADAQYKPWVKYRLAQLYVHKNELNSAKKFIAEIEVGDDDELKGKVKKLRKKLKKLMS